MGRTFSRPRGAGRRGVHLLGWLRTVTVKRVALQVKPIGKKRSNPSSLTVSSSGAPKARKPLPHRTLRRHQAGHGTVFTCENLRRHRVEARPARAANVN